MIDKIAPMAASATSVCFRRSDNSAISASHGDRLGSCASLSGHGETGPAPRIKGNYKQYEVFSYDKNLLVEDNQHTGALISLPIATDRRSSK